MWQNTLTLFAQAANEGAAKVPDIVWFQNWWAILLLLVAVITFSCVFGKTMARKVRMQDYWWKIALILGSVGCAGVIVVTGWPPKYGVDLEGGVTLIYEVEDSEEKIDIAALVQALKKRINPSGVKEIIIRPYGDNKVEIIVPGLDAQEIEACASSSRTLTSIPQRPAVSKSRSAVYMPRVLRGKPLNMPRVVCLSSPTEPSVG